MTWTRVAIAGAAALAIGCGSGETINESAPANTAQLDLVFERTTCAEASGIACTWAGTGRSGYNGDDHSLRGTRLYWPFDIEFAPDGAAWVLDWNNHRVRRQDGDNLLSAIGTDLPGDGDGSKDDWAPPGVEAELCALNHPTDLQFKDDGTLYFAAWHNHKIRIAAVDSTDGLLKEYVLGGRGNGFSGDGGNVGKALFDQPKAIALAKDGTLYISDQRNLRIRKVAADGTVSTIVGKPELNDKGMIKGGFGGDGGKPADAQLNFMLGGNPEPTGALALGDNDTKLYIADSLNHRIRVVDFAVDTIDTLAGSGEPGFDGDGGPAKAAKLNSPRDIEVSPDGTKLFIADTDNLRIRAVDLASGTITTVAGSGVAVPKDADGSDLGWSAEDVQKNEGVPPTQLNLRRPMGIGFDKDGNLYIADSFNNRIVKVTK